MAQDVFPELFRVRERLQSDDHMRFWLRRLSVHRATDWLRRSNRQPEATLHPQMQGLALDINYFSGPDPEQMRNL